MPRLNIRTTDERRSREAFSAHIQYQEEATTTPSGRKAEDLRTRGHEISDQGNFEEAHALYREALDQFPAEDLGAAAAAALYDLGESYARQHTGSKLENLQEAERLLRRSLTSKARQRDPIRLALTHDALGRVLRHLGKQKDHEERNRLEREGIQHIRQACQIMESIGPIGWVAAGEYFTNLGNALEQNERYDEAIRAHELSIHYIRGVEENIKHPIVSVLLSIRSHFGLAKPFINLASVLQNRGKPEDIVRALSLCTDAEKISINEDKERAKLFSAQLHYKLGDNDNAFRLAKEVQLNILPDSEHPLLAQLFLDIGKPAQAVAVARRGINQAMAIRRQALADHLADHAATQAQRFGVLAACGWIELGDAVSAFLEIENVSSLRYYDSISPQARKSPSEPVARGATLVLYALGMAAKNLDELASRISHMPEPMQRDVLSKYINIAGIFLNAEGSGTVSRSNLKVLRDELEDITKASSHPSPITALREAAKRHLQRHNNLQANLQARGTPSKEHEVWETSMPPEALKAVLAESGHVAVRVHLSDKMVVAAVWVENGELQGRCEQRPVPEGLIGRLIAEASGQDSDNIKDLPEWTTVTKSLDISNLIPAKTKHLLILPSLMASLVPWAAVGQNQPLVTQVDAISILPGLLPLWSRQAYSPPRSGLLTVAPADYPGDCATRFHAAALSVNLPNETRLLQAAATTAALESAAANSDVVMFYAHGNGGQVEDPGISLVDDTYMPPERGPTWVGVERVELWACRSGINLPDDPLIPFVDDAFGLDIKFHQAGVRSTIGTLWSVPDFVTGCIVARYRKALNDGRLAPAALADAQRWWLSTGVPYLLTLLRNLAEEQAIRIFLDTLGISEPVSTRIGGVLGPLPADGKLPPSELNALEKQLTSPLAWAGYRFVGVCERRPDEIRPIMDVVLTTEQEAEVEQLLMAAPSQKWNIDSYQQNQLNEMVKAVEGRSPTPDEAIHVARIYADYRPSSPRHNLLRGLAWLHEVLANPDLEDGSRQRLSVEAAWMWLELGRGDTSDEQFISLFADQVAVARAATLLKGIPQTSDVLVLLAWIELFQGDPTTRDERSQRRWQKIRRHAQVMTDDAYANLRRNRSVLEFALCMREIPADAGELANVDTNKMVGNLSGPPFILHHRELTRTVVLRRLGLSGGNGFNIQYLPHRDLPRATQLRLTGHDDSDPNWGDHLDALYEGLDLVESHYWGDPSDNREKYWSTTGAPTRAWMFAGGTFLIDQVRQSDRHTNVSHYLACLQLGADLRVAPLTAWARTTGGFDENPLSDLGQRVWAIDHMLRFLSDAAAIPDIRRDGSASHTPSPAFDPFAKSPEALVIASEASPLAGTAWLISNSLQDWFKVSIHGRTAAFSMELLLFTLQNHVKHQWQFQRKLADGELREKVIEHGHTENIDAFHKLLDPDADIKTMEASLREIPDGVVVLGLYVGIRGEIMALSLWRANNQLYEKSFVSDQEVGWRLVQHIADVLSPSEVDHTPQRGWANHRVAAWAAALAILEPILQQILGPATSRLRHLRVFAPGPLRSLPAVGLMIRGVPLSSLFGSVSLLPSLGFERRVPTEALAHPFTLCTLGPTHKTGETCFGEAAIHTLRRWFPPEVVADAIHPVGKDIVEADAIVAVKEKVNVVRFYGVGHPFAINGSTVGLLLPGGRTFLLAHTRMMTLPATSAVEIWAAVGGVSERQSTLSFDGDVLPALTRSFLMNGAAGVLDLAWPVHDLVKAMVAECFGATRRLGPLWEPVALVRAVEWVATLLKMWRKDSPSFRTKAEALRWLDEARMIAAQEAQLNPHAVVHFESFATTPSLPDSVTDLVEEICQPVHLAAFRWWGA